MLSLYEVPVRMAGRVDEGGTTLRVEVHVRRPERLAEHFSGAVVRDDAVTLALGDRDTLPGEPGERQRSPSFVIDWDEKPVVSLHARLVAEQGASPSLDALREFASRAIPHKTLSQGWDLASAIARNGAGDCTEHAVLLAALARSVGRPARVVVGVLLVEAEGKVAGFGHAWTEIHDGTRWRLVDATPIGEQPGLRYLPLFAIEDEGPGYTMALATATQALWVREIAVLGTR
jgi:Transglutaminase-like superfamily